MEEIWKECGESKLKNYEVSNLGRVKSIDKKNGFERYLTHNLDKDGYHKVSISGKGNKFIHHLVAYAFKGDRPENNHIDHIDRNKLNNKVENLRYCTFSENMINREFFRDDILEIDKKERQKIITKQSNKKRLENRYICECGGKTSQADKSHHIKSKKHQNYLANLENNL
jgi:hypothetical protein